MIPIPRKQIFFKIELNLRWSIFATLLLFTCLLSSCFPGVEDQIKRSESNPWYPVLKNSAELTLSNLQFAIRNGYSDAELLSDSCQVYIETIEALRVNRITPSQRFENTLNRIRELSC